MDLPPARARAREYASTYAARVSQMHRYVRVRVLQHHRGVPLMAISEPATSLSLFPLARRPSKKIPNLVRTPMQKLGRLSNGVRSRRTRRASANRFTPVSNSADTLRHPRFVDSPP